LDFGISPPERYVVRVAFNALKIFLFMVACKPFIGTSKARKFPLCEKGLWKGKVTI
jgi:hypothetical protein